MIWSKKKRKIIWSKSKWLWSEAQNYNDLKQKQKIMIWCTENDNDLKQKQQKIIVIGSKGKYNDLKHRKW